MRVLLPIPCEDFDPTEAAVPWKILSAAGIEVIVATPNGAPANADPIVLSGEKLGILKAVLRTDANGRSAYEEFHAKTCASPASYENIEASDFDALILPGGHAPKMRSYLESTRRAIRATCTASHRSCSSGSKTPRPSRRALDLEARSSKLEARSSNLEPRTSAP